MTSFLYLVSYRAHCGAIVAVFISGPKHAQDRGRHKTVMHRNQQYGKITVFTVPKCEKRAVVAVRTVTTVAPRCTARQDR